MYRLFQTNGCALLWEAKVRGLCRFEFSPNAEFLAVLDADNLRLFRTTSGEVRWRVPRHDSYPRVSGVAWSEDGHWVAAALVRRDVSLISARTGEVVVQLANPSMAAVTEAVFSPDGRYLAVTLADQSVLLWALKALHHDLAGLGLDWQEE